MLTYITGRGGSVLIRGQDWRVLKIARELPARDGRGLLDMPCPMHRARQTHGVQQTLQAGVTPRHKNKNKINQ
jgi:hypothetical protein